MRVCQGEHLYSNNIPQRKLYFNSKSYDWPEPFKSDTDFNRFTGADIPGMEALERWKELKRLENTLAWVDDKAILITDLSSGQIKVITKQNWTLQRLKKLKELPHGTGIGKYI